MRLIPYIVSFPPVWSSNLAAGGTILPPHHLTLYRMKTSSINALLEAAGLVILHLTQNKTLQKTMSGFGFPAQRLQVGEHLLNDIRQVGSTRNQDTGEARRLTHQIDQDGEVAFQTFRDHVAVARAAFRQKPLALQELKISKLLTGKWNWRAAGAGVLRAGSPAHEATTTIRGHPGSVSAERGRRSGTAHPKKPNASLGSER